MGEKIFFFVWLCLLNPLMYFLVKSLNDPHLVYFYVIQHKGFLTVYFLFLFAFAFYFLVTSKNKNFVGLFIFIALVQLICIAFMKSQ